MNKNPNHNLQTNGIHIFSERLNEIEMNDCLNHIDDDSANYTQVKSFIDNVYFPKVNNTFNWNCIYTKFRLSDFTNLKDASFFHSDVYNYTDSFMPIYTGLCYFDDSTLEIIPHSNIKNNNNFSCLFNTKQTIDVKAGTIIVFNSTLYHRGMIKDNSAKHRRLLQIFDIFPNRTIFNTHFPKFYTVSTKKSSVVNIYNNYSIFNNVGLNVTNETVLYLHYLLMYFDVQYKLICDVPNKCDKYITYEPGTRDTIKVNGRQPLNVNIIIIDTKQIDPEINVLFMYVILIILIILIAYLIYYHRDKISTKLLKN